MFVRYTNQAIYIKALIISNKIFVLWIILNPLDLRSFFVFILAGIRYEGSKSNNTADIFARVTVTMNLIVVAQFFEIISINIFDH